MNFDLENKVAIVTGASRGLGMAAARSLAAEGCKILAAARSVEDLRKFESELPDSIRACPCDMTDIDAVRTLPARAVEEFGRLDIVVNNAGIAPAGLFLDQDDRVWDEVFAINVTAPAMLAKEAARIMVRQGSGKIINVASTSGILGKRFLVAYSSSKGAVLQFTKALAGELARDGIQVNAIAPGAFVTDAQQAVLESPDLLARRIAKIPSKRMGDSREMGPLVCYLASPLSDFVTGGVFVIDGGESSQL